MATITGTDPIAGSTLTLDKAMRNAVAAGLPLQMALAAATAHAATYLNLPDVGRFGRGMRADAVLLDRDDLSVTRVYRPAPA